MAAGVVTLAGAALAACGNNSNSSSSGTKKTLNWMDKTEIEGMDVSKVTDATSFTQLNNTMEGLYRLGKNSKVEPGLATKTSTSKDGKTWTFTLRKNDKWSNGDPVTAKDFVYSWRRTVTPSTGSQYSYLFSGIKNADDIVAGKKKPNTLGVKAEGDDKLVVTLDKRIPYFKLLMGFPLFSHKTKRQLRNSVRVMVLLQRLLSTMVRSFKQVGRVLTFPGNCKRTRATGTRRTLNLIQLTSVFKRRHQLTTTFTNQVNWMPLCLDHKPQKN